MTQERIPAVSPCEVFNAWRYIGKEYNRLLAEVAEECCGTGEELPEDVLAARAWYRGLSELHPDDLDKVKRIATRLVALSLTMEGGWLSNWIVRAAGICPLIHGRLFDVDNLLATAEWLRDAAQGNTRADEHGNVFLSRPNRHECGGRA